MKVYIKDIKPEGLDLSEQMEMESIGLTKKDYIQFVSPLEIKAHVERAQNTVLSNVQVNSRICSYCSRTLERVERDWAEDFTLDFEIPKGSEYIDMAEDIRQEVIVRLPMRVLSDEELKKEKQQSRSQPAAEGPPEGMYRPFDGLKIKE